MIVRIQRLKISHEKIGDFERYVANSNMKQHKVCVQAIAAKNVEKTPCEVALVTIWTDVDALKAFTNGKWKEPKITPEVTSFMADKPIVEVYELITM